MCCGRLLISRRRVVILVGRAMVTLRETASHIKEVREEEWRVLSIIERNLGRYERFPVERIVRITGYSKEFVDEVIRRLAEYGWVERFLQPYESVRLLTSGADAIALRMLAEKNIVVGVGRQIGVGKESDVYEAIGPDGSRLSLKVFRLGRISFRDIARKRDYFDASAPNRPSWILRNYMAARKEFRVLKYLYRCGVSVPKPIANVKHIIVMEELDGDILINVRDLPDPRGILERIIEEVRKAYDAGVVNGDLSPFNIFITRDYRVIIIDWPQAIYRDKGAHEDALIRDVTYIAQYFSKKYGVSVDVESVLREKFGLELRREGG
ncbi:serine/threonine protein kinase [Candidatus Geothermarchaeota archaeon ex4572_27]|nr:MAG: serine/threonine protein kinase [Candidatus Geothermarchaeota archaeon ex4572_27]